MLDMGFAENIASVVKAMPKQRQTTGGLSTCFPLRWRVDAISPTQSLQPLRRAPNSQRAWDQRKPHALTGPLVMDRPIEAPRRLALLLVLRWHAPPQTLANHETGGSVAALSAPQEGRARSVPLLRLCEGLPAGSFGTFPLGADGRVQSPNSSRRYRPPCARWSFLSSW